MSRRALPALLLLAACSDGLTGGLTATLVIEDRPGIARRALRAEAVPMEVDRLVISAHDTAGSTLAVTRLAVAPTGDELPLTRAGGTWRLDEVPVGADRALVANAFLSPNLGPGLGGRLGFSGRKVGLEVRGDQVTDAGTITLTLVDGVRIPRLDTVSPTAPNPISATPSADGQSFEVTWTRPRDPDVAGYLVLITGTSTAPPPSPAGSPAALPPGTELAPGVFVVAWIEDPAVSMTTALALRGLTAQTIFVYAYDSDLDGSPLNFSPAAVTQAMVGDRDPPSAFVGLALAPLDEDGVVVSFIGPSDDTTGGGRPAEYEVRTSTVRAELESPASFSSLPARAPPAIVDPGTMGTQTTSVLALGQDGRGPFFYAIRAKDEVGNAGPIAVAEFVPGAPMAPLVEALAPEIGLAGRELELRGRRFGTLTGSVALEVRTGTVTRVLPIAVRSWAPTTVLAQLPSDAASGRLRLTRAVDAAMAAATVSVLAESPGTPLPVAPPFAIATASVAGASVHAIYEADDGLPSNHGVRRMFGETAIPALLAPFAGEVPAAVSGAYSAATSLFAFAAATPSTITGALVSSSTTAPGDLRVSLANIDGADGVGLALLPTSTAAPAPALLAFTRDGLLRTATVADVRVDAFGPFTLVDSSTRGVSAVQLLYADTATGAEASFLVGRVGTGTTATLALWSQAGTRPGGFTEDAPGRGPPLASRFALVDAPGVGLVIAYEHRAPDGRVEVRLLAQRHFGQGRGLSPYPQAVALNHRLEDVGLVPHAGGPWISLATTTPGGGGGRQLYYAEIDPAALVSDGYGATSGLALETALDAGRAARLGGRPAASPIVPLLWNGPMGGKLYLRR